jgi:hypothetical protein
MSEKDKANRINSSSAHITVDSLDWLRKTHEDNITWIPLFADYYYSYRAVEQQWWYVDEEKKFKVDDAPDTETVYQEMKKI